MTEKIDHKAAALGLLDSLHDWQGEVGSTDEVMLTVAIEAQTRAALYLAEQQAAAVEQARFANLIALEQHEVRGGIASASRLYEKEPEETTREAVLKPSIRKGLGL